MKCVVCKTGETRPGTTTITLEPEGANLVLKGVRAEIREICGEAYVDSEITRRLIAIADGARRTGIQVDVRQFSNS
jgi:YgiT-type zinc finger domain-containing protein